MTTEVVPSNEFTVDFNEDKSLVTINFQGLQKSRLDALEVQVDEIAADLADAIITAGGNTSTVAADLAALTGVVTAQGVDIAAEPPIRADADTALNLAIVTLSDDTDAAIAAEAATRLDADNAEIAARDAAIAAALVTPNANIAALQAADIALNADINAVETSQTTVLADVAALDTAFDALSANFTSLSTDVSNVEAAVLAESNARATSEAALAADITDEIADRIAADDAIVASLGTAAALDVDTDTSLAANSDTVIATQKATKTYIDAKVAGLSWKQAVRVATTTAGTLATDFENGDTIDGVVLVTGDRILIKDQAAPAENGIYVVVATGAPTRATDADSSAELVNASVYVSEGTVWKDTQWTCNADAPIVVDTTALNFVLLDTGGTGHTHTFATITLTPTTLAGYGITDAAALSHTHAYLPLTAGGTVPLTGALYMSLVEPTLWFHETDAPTDEKYWRFVTSSGNFYLQTRDDALGTGATALRIVRTGTQIDSITLDATTEVVVKGSYLSAYSPGTTSYIRQFHSGTTLSHYIVGNATDFGFLNEAGSWAFNIKRATKDATFYGNVLVSAGYIELGHSSDTTLSRIAAGRVAMEGVEIGFRQIPRSTTTTTLAVADVGKCVAIAAGITVPNAVFAAGDVVYIYNNSAGSLTITQGASLTLRHAGTANTGDRTLAQRGMATIWFNTASEAIISGTGLT